MPGLYFIGEVVDVTGQLGATTSSGLGLGFAAGHAFRVRRQDDAEHFHFSFSFLIFIEESLTFFVSVRISRIVLHLSKQTIHQITRITTKEIRNDQ